MKLRLRGEIGTGVERVCDLNIVRINFLECQYSIKSSIHKLSSIRFLLTLEYAKQKEEENPEEGSAVVVVVDDDRIGGLKE